MLSGVGGCALPTSSFLVSVDFIVWVRMCHVPKKENKISPRFGSFRGGGAEQVLNFKGRGDRAP